MLAMYLGIFMEVILFISIALIVVGTIGLIVLNVMAYVYSLIKEIYREIRNYRVTININRVKEEQI